MASSKIRTQKILKLIEVSLSQSYSIKAVEQRNTRPLRACLRKQFLLGNKLLIFEKTRFLFFLILSRSFNLQDFFCVGKYSNFFFLNHEYPSPIYNVKLPEDVIGHSSQIAILTIFSKTRECWCIDFANYTMYKSSID